MIDKPPANVQFYEIRLKGHLDVQWVTWFDGLTITLENGDTLLSGPVADQAALHGLLKKVRDLGMPLVSVYQVQFDETHQVHSKQGETNMNSIKKIDTKVLLSTLWIVVMLNMLKADILSLFIPGAAEEVARTSASAGASIPQLMLIGAVMGQLGIAMIVLSRVLRNQSLGKHRREHCQYRLHLGRYGVVSPLYFHRHGRDALLAADRLVCVDLA